MFDNKKEYRAIEKHFSSKSSSDSQQKPAPEAGWAKDEVLHDFRDLKCAKEDNI